jgi:hydroxymethylbilane synthase
MRVVSDQVLSLRIATRGSALALWQAQFVQAKLEASGVSSALVIVETQGDKNLAPFSALQGQGFFTKAVQDAVLDGRADLAVHSLKDLPSSATPGLTVAAIPEREDARDVLLARPEAVDAARPLALRAGSRLGTSAVRRRAQALMLDGALEVRELRGNVPTRVDKLRRGEYDAIVLAAAGLKRLGLELDDLYVQPLEPHVFVPAPGQGALALECRADDAETVQTLRALEDRAARETVAAERGLMARLHGGCQLALGAWARLEGEAVALTAWYAGRVYETNGSSAADVAERAFALLSKDHPEVLVA